MRADAFDVLEAALEIEQRLGVALPSDATIEQLADRVAEGLAAEKALEVDPSAPGLSDDELTGLAMDWLRQELLVHVSTASQHVQRDTPAADAIPLPSRRYLWRVWQHEGLVLPPLLPSEPATRFAALSSLVRGLVACVALFPLIGAVAAIVGIVVWLLSLISTGMILQQWFSWRLPANTCGELARSIGMMNLQWLVRRSGRRLSRRDVTRLVRAAIADVTGVPVEKITPQAKLAQLLD